MWAPTNRPHSDPADLHMVLASDAHRYERIVFTIIKAA